MEESDAIILRISCVVSININMKHFVVMTHFLKSVSLLIEGLLFIYIGYFSQIWL